jgi:hypothetical protein
MIFPQLHGITSPTLEPPALPPDPLDCAIDFQVIVGPKGSGESETFTFTVVTPVHLARIPEPTWGRGLLILPSFDWSAVVRAVAQLMADCARPSWREVAAELSRQLRREAPNGPQ